MTGRATFLRWLATFPAFPIGGLLAVTLVGSVTDPLRAFLAGALAGAVIGTAQWLALRPSGLSAVWVAVTAAAVAVGSSISVAITSAGTSTGELVLTGLITGATLGIGQSFLTRGGGRTRAAWAALLAVSWALGWFVTANVIVDADRGYVTFGSSGALLATLLTGLLVRRLVVQPVIGHAERPADSASPTEASEVQR